MTRDRRRAEDFTKMLFHFHREDADALAKHLDLSGHRKLLDVGGGSGVMSIALAQANPHLSACVLDIKPVCRVTSGIVRRAGLSRRIKTLSGDIRQALPDRLRRNHVLRYRTRLGAAIAECLEESASWRPRCRRRSLFLRRRHRSHWIGCSVAWLARQCNATTRAEMASAMRSCGFRSVKAKRVWRDLWCITGTKPSRR